ncbi:membrane-tethered transcription factor [Aspergillus heteromorphus CBS 117.55]|uniref:Membrane-tethered transcription factor n=1 Tax=Aspergillus heteromorphus CBS 117.55 TaxID=1448321 RepID=A0A317VWS2_9EURO|nr:membrane-tethered transcription factor [Aspergillus heteromorphus CBS 117.55]PWY77432.1 membrane-tethered transcription factor [Aspergillus heteromorphus CBS 117.55]
MMGSAEAASSPAFPFLDPIVVDDEMGNPYHDTDMDFLDTARMQVSAENAGRDFDDILFSRAPPSHPATESEPSCLSPSELSLKRSYQEQDTLRQVNMVSSDSPAESPDGSSPSSSSTSPRNHVRNPSVTSSASAVHSENTVMPFGYSTDDWMNPDLSSLKEESLFGLDLSMPNLDGGFPTDTDLESSNKAMDAAFDFESAASSPSPLKTEPPPQPKFPKRSKSQYRSVSGASSRNPASPMTASSFLSRSTKEPSPFSSSRSFSRGKSPLGPWGNHSPSSFLEESFGGISMNGGSPMSSGLNFGPSSFPFGVNFAPSPSPGNIKQETIQRHLLTVHPTSLKSRVETQIPIRLTLFPLPNGVKKVRLPSHTISKPKFLAPPAAERSPEIVELHTSLVCTSAMQDQDKVRKAFARARGENPHGSSSSSPRPADDMQEEDKPLDGGEVKICPGCIQRERKRAFRKKQRKPEEDELFQKDEEKRVIVFNTSEIKDWTEPSKNAMPGYGDAPMPNIPPGAMQVELPMRIACYCRHQNEKLGFQVIFTVKDYKDNVIAQAITNSIMITDDHKTHAPPAPPAPGPSPSLPDGTQLPGVGVFPSSPSVETGKGSTPSQQTTQPSATDLQGLQQRFNTQYQMTPGSFAVSQSSTNGTTPSNAPTPRSLSRQTSPNDFQGPVNKRRKHSNSGRLPTELTMTKLESTQASASASSSSAPNEPQFSGPRGFTSPVERPFVTSAAMSNQFPNGPPTPNGGDTNPFLNTALQQQTLDSFIQQQLMSAPNSAQPSRPGTPGPSSRNNFQDQNFNISLGPSPSTSLWPPLTNAGNRLPSVIHKLVPAEGSVTGGTEVTLLGSGFYPGMEVVFGDTLATTTTFWGDKCLNCLTPPALQPGLVAVVFKHEHPTFGQLQTPQTLMPKQQQYFRYVDDRELQMYRLALGILGQKLGSQADAFQTAQQIMGSDMKGVFNLQNDFQGGSGGHQRQVPGLESQGKLGDLDSRMLTYLEFVDLDDSPRPPKYNSRSATGQSLLHFASSLGLTRFVAGLLARGANPDVQDNSGNTPMHLAALNGHAHIVHRLRLTGANPYARSIRGFTPADLATTLPAHQAALIPARHYRSRSVGSLSSSRRRHSSSASLHSLWETSSASGSFDHAVDDSDDSEDDDDEIDYNASRRSSIHHDRALISTPPDQTTEADDARPFSPPAALVAWRNQLQAQINQFQQSVSNAFPNLPALPPMPALPDYQAHPMMRRITNLVPHRPSTARSAKDGWWDMLTGSSPSAPPPSSTPSGPELPSYEELYPNKGNDEEEEQLKKSSMLQAATDAALDQHFEAQASASEAPRASSATEVARVKPQNEELKDIRIGRKVISREEQKHLREQQAQRMKGLSSDRKLYMVWIPLLLLVICAWARNSAPGIWEGLSSGYEFVKNRYAQGALEVGH